MPACVGLTSQVGGTQLLVSAQGPSPLPAGHVHVHGEGGRVREVCPHSLVQTLPEQQCGALRKRISEDETRFTWETGELGSPEAGVHLSSVLR